ATFYRAKLSDPTGAMALTAGSYQPRAAAQLSAITERSLAIVIGKAHLYRGRDGSAVASIRAEAVQPVGEHSYQLQLLDAVEQTVTRIELSERLRAPDPPTDERLSSEGVPELWRRGVRVAREMYPSVDPAAFRPGLLTVLDVVEGVRPVPDETPSSKVAVRRDAPKAPPPPPVREDRVAEAALLELIDELSDGSMDGYADLKEAVGRAREQGLSSERTEELIDRLEASGVLEEPIVGKLRRA
ncbi:MAG: hypothetical protein L3K09_01120, partial [Thermoplasmata archaeon]|nr:hypothetical protein [Thermoplasmata archaeon]